MIEARIERMVYGGDGLARIDGKTALVSLVLPGELVEIAPVKDEPRLLRARLERIVEPAPGRVDPDCRYFGHCGGCHYQHALYEDQLRFKSEILVETLRRLGKLTAPEPEIVAGEEFRYRNRVQFKIIKRGTEFRIGYLQRASDKLVDIDRCPIASPAINALIPDLLELGRRPDFPAGPSEIEIVDGQPELLITVRGEGRFPETLIGAFRERMPQLVSFARGDSEGGFFRLWGRGHMNIRAGGFEYRVSHGVFFQTNRFMLDRLIEVATQDFSGAYALDLYAGAGYFTLPLARRFARVEAVEANGAATRDLQANAKRAELANIELHRGATAEYLANAEHARRDHARDGEARAGEAPHAGEARAGEAPQGDGARPDFVLVDPPRAGLGKHEARSLAALGAPAIVYVSCDPPTLARDLAVLVENGYRLEKIYMVDLFPQTFHIESVTVLRK